MIEEKNELVGCEDCSLVECSNSRSFLPVVPQNKFVSDFVHSESSIEYVYKYLSAYKSR